MSGRIRFMILSIGKFNESGTFKAFPSIIWMVLLLIAAACSPPEMVRVDPGVFEPSPINKVEFFEKYSAGNSTITSLDGRANVQVSEPGNSERLSVSFRSDREQSLLTLRNNLNIEGGRIYSDPDSVIIYNRLEETAHKMSHADASWYYLNGIAAINLLQILHPITHPDQISGIFENEAYYLVETHRDERHYIEREHMVLRRTDRTVYHQEAYSTFEFDNYADIAGFQVPRRIRILSYDEKSNIFFVIRALEINPSELEFDPNIPGDIEIIRL